MRILFTSDYYPPHIGGGVEVVVSELAERMAGMGHEVMVATLGRGDALEDEVRNGVRVRRFPAMRLSKFLGLELTWSSSAPRGIEAAFQEFEPDVVSAHHIYFTTTPAAIRAAGSMQIPTVLTLHIAELGALGGWKGSAARLYGRLVAHPLVARAGAVIAVSEAVARTVRNPDVSVEVIRNGVDVERFRPRPSPGAGSTTRFLFVGRLIANKGPDIALQAFRRVHERLETTSLTFVGDGPMRNRLARLTRRYGLTDSVHFVGLRDDVAHFLRGADVFVRPSLIEGLPLTALEAMATGLPVIAADVGGVREVVEDGVTGFVVRPASIEDTETAMYQLAVDREMAQRFGIAGRERAEGYSWESVADATLDVFESVIRSRSG